MKAGDDGEVLEWQVRLWESDPSKRYVCLAAAVLAGLAALLIVKSPLLAIMAPTVVVFSTAEMFFPIRHRLDNRAARMQIGLSASEIEWGDVKRVIELSDSIRLSPLEKPSRLDAFRGVLLRFSGNEEAVCAKIRELRQKNEQIVAGPSGTGGGGSGD